MSQNPAPSLATVDVTYRCLVADPPWPHLGGGGRGAQEHYALMTVPDITKLMRELVEEFAAPDAHLWLWVTNTLLAEGLAIMRDCGFRYRTNLVWTKDRIGMGQYLRGQHELCLFGVRGATMYPPRRDVPSVVAAKRREHSRKPDEVYAAIARVSPGPRLELFSREGRPGWDTWGDEAGKLG